MRWIIGLAGLALAAACTVETTEPTPLPIGAPSSSSSFSSAAEASQAFSQVVSRLEPTAERACLQLRPDRNCNFKIVVDTRRGEPSNAYQTVDESGRPVITFTLALIGEARNSDELAFIMGHEAAHHIRSHLQRQAENAAAGAVIFAGLATLTGGSAADVATAQELGEFVGARSYSKEFELEADDLGTVIAYRAGYDPLVGAQFFTRIPDPGNAFLGTHPPNGARYSTVTAALSRLEG